MPRSSLGDRIYRALLRLYPAEFRGDFGDDMSADFNEQRRDAWRDEGLGGLVRVWAATLADALQRAPREQLALLVEDARFALRMIRRHLASTTVIVLLLALGIGANITVFGFAEPWIRRPLPVPQGRELVRLITEEGAASQQFAHATFKDIQSRSKAFAGVAAHQYATVAFGLGESGRSMDGEVVSGNYFDVLGVQPALGRMLQPSDDTVPGAHPVAVISFDTWREFFAGATNVVGRVIHLNGHSFEVIGVAPPGFSGSYTAFASRFWTPIAMYTQVRPRNISLDARGWSWLAITARLRPGISQAEAAADVRRVHAGLKQEWPNVIDAEPYALIPASGLPEGIRQSARGILAFAATIAVLVLLVACANVAGVLQSRATARIRETSIRFALGATRFRVVRQWLTESLFVALLGAAAGLMLAQWMNAALVGLMGGAAPFEVRPPGLMGSSILLFTVLIAVISGLAFGLLPALRVASRGERALREHAGTLTSTRWGVRSTRALVAIQVCASVALLVTAGLLTRSMKNATTYDVGFDPAGLVGASLPLERYGYDRARSLAFVNEVVTRLRAEPDIVAASRAAVAPLGGGSERLGFRIPGYVSPTGRSVVSIDVNAVSTGYFATMGIPILHGRDFHDHDTAGAGGVAIVNATMASRFWPRGAIGQTIVPAGPDAKPIQIAGVVEDIKYYSLDESPRPYVYLPAEQAGPPAALIHARTSGSEAAAIRTLKRIVNEIDRAVIVDDAMTFAELRRQPLAGRHAMMVMANLFGALALLLTLVGIYGTMSNAIGQRSREIGVRMAFGASVANVFQMVLRDGLKPIVVGIVFGLIGANVAARLIASELFGVTGADPVTHAVAVIAVTGAAVAALVVPARRATRVNPVAVLRD